MHSLLLTDLRRIRWCESGDGPWPAPTFPPPPSPAALALNVEQDLAALFKITREKARELLLAAPKTIKENLALEDAAKYKEAIEKTGAACSVENMKFDLGGLSLE